MTVLASGGFTEKYYAFRRNCFGRAAAMPASYKLALAFGMAAATGISAQLRFYLPWTPVPVTGQTIAVLLSGALLGARWGAASQAIYIALGIAGLPWFAGFGGGLQWITGPTAGYAAGFIPAAFMCGYFSSRYPGSRYFISMFSIMSAANFLFIHGFGLIHFSLWSRAAGAEHASLFGLCSASTLPFIPGDLFKILISSLAVKSFLPKQGIRID